MSGNIGPGQYAFVTKTVEGPQFTMGSINYHSKKDTSISPGPGTYKQDKLSYKSYSYSMGTKSGLQNNKSTYHIPAPNAYNPKSSYSLKYDGHTKFG